ncbi:hypothetical protein G646_gp178 [Serratia phage phiMAM1]|uniref:Uncharacterized protein n=1 Tax=Serratia phage phiMAM1 TaxID=1262513 RepID=K7YJ01_9CAUD|nr:hypothetical protein G646_gp178 [Serratia phage phiMAM1]AFX93646.1 hypothetical protein MAM_178 [Serratia phage phiMAM1]
MTERQTFTCECGFSWLQGLSGSHSCTPGYQKQIKELKERVESYGGVVPRGYALVPIQPTEEQLRRMLAVHWPATYREYLRHPMNGPENKKENEKQISQAERQYAAILMDFLPVVQNPVGYECRFYDTMNERWGDWEPVRARGILHTVMDRVKEIQYYIEQGYRYELRALYAERICGWVNPNDEAVDKEGA